MPMPASEVRRLIVAVTGASGALYAVRLLRAALMQGHTIELVCSEYGKRLLIEECAWNVKTTSFEEWCAARGDDVELRGRIVQHRERDQGASIASGSQRWDGMIVVPCSMKTLSGIAHGGATNLIERAADVTLKERTPLVLVPRETPFNRIHLQNLLAAHDAGASIVPAMPAFYQGPADFDALADFVVGRIFALLDLEHELFEPWKG